MSDTPLNWHTHANTLVERLFDVFGGVLGGMIAHFMTEKHDGSGKTVERNGKPVMILDPDKVRAHAPYFVLDLQDEAEFNGLVVNIAPALQKNLEIQMGPIQPGPYLPGHAPGLGQHQRADVILTTVQINERKGLKEGTERVDTIKMIEILGQITDPFQWKRRAIAFKLMRENESDYLGAQMTEKAGKAFVEFLDIVNQLNVIAQDQADELNHGTNELQHGLRVRRNFGPIRKIWNSFARAMALPYGSMETSTMCDDNRDDNRNNNTERDNHENTDCGRDNPRRSKIGISGCLDLGKFFFDLGFYRQARKPEPQPEPATTQNNPTTSTK